MMQMSVHYNFSAGTSAEQKRPSKVSSLDSWQDATPRHGRKHQHHVKQQIFSAPVGCAQSPSGAECTIKPHAELFGLVERPGYEGTDSLHSALAQLLVRVRLLRLPKP